MKRIIVYFLEKIDRLISKVYLALFRERNSLSIFLFHSLFRDEKEINSGVVDINPQQAVTVDYFRQFITYYLKEGYIFISPNDILKGLKNDKKYALITFDDGYYNNHLAVPVLNEFEAPAIFFISAGNIKENKSFWWDVLYRERKKQGIPIEKIYNERKELMNKIAQEKEKYLIDRFGAQSLNPIGDIDRPFNPSELADFSKEKYVFIGNHTDNHAMLTEYSSSGVKMEISNAQNSIYDITGRAPDTIAYPYGKFSEEIADVVKEIGLKVGFTTVSKKNYFPIKNFLKLNRFVVYGNDLKTLGESFRSDIQLMFFIRKLFKK